MKKILCFILLVGAVSSPFGASAQTLPPFELQIPEEPEAVEVQTAIPAPEYTFGKVRFALDVAGSIRVGKAYDGDIYGLTSSGTNPVEQLRYGISYGASITGFSNTSFGWGAKFIGNHYSMNYDELSDKINTFYIGPEFVTRLPTASRRNAWVFAASMGYVHYTEKLEYETQESVLNKGGFKTVVEAGYDIRMGRNSFFGLKIALTAGYIPFKIDGETHNESLNAIEIGGGFRF